MTDPTHYDRDPSGANNGICASCNCGPSQGHLPGCTGATPNPEPIPGILDRLTGTGAIHAFTGPPDHVAFDEALTEYENQPTDTPADRQHIYDPNETPGITQLPAVTTNLTPEQFNAWVESDGDMFMVMLPAQKSFIIKVPAEHNPFFVAMMQQVKFALGPEVQAIRMNLVTGPPADIDAATGKADEAPAWANPPATPPTEHVVTRDRVCCDTTTDQIHDPACDTQQPRTERTFATHAAAVYCDVSDGTIVNWWRAGKLPNTTRTPGGKRRYTERDLDAVRTNR